MGEGELKCHRSPLQTFSLSPSSSTPLLPPPSEPNFHNFQLVRSKRVGEDSGWRGPEAETRTWSGS